MNLKRKLLVACLFLLAVNANSQFESTKIDNLDSSRSYTEVITSKAKTQKGIFWIHNQQDKWYFEIPDSMFNRDILVVSRIAKSSADLRAQFYGYAGDQINELVIRFV